MHKSSYSALGSLGDSALGGGGIVYLDDLFGIAQATVWTFIIMVFGLAVTFAEGCDLAALSSAAPLVIKHFHFSPNMIGLLFSSALIGTILSSYFLSPIADRHGRRPAVLAGLSIACIATAAATLAPNGALLLISRICAGVGIGLTTPSILAQIAETIPTRMRAMGTMIASCGFIFGAAFSNLVVSQIASSYGYCASFIVASGVEFVVALFCIVLLVESPFFLVRKGRPLLSRSLRRIGVPAIEGSTHFGVRQQETGSTEVRALFGAEHRKVTLLLWLANFCTLSVVYMTSNWIPALLVRSGQDMGSALRFLSMASFLGGIASLLTAAITIRIGPAKLLVLSATEN